MNQMLRHFAVTAIALMLLTGATMADEFGAAADVPSDMLAEAEKDIAMPRIEGRWVAFYNGREGRVIYDLTTRTEYDRIRQWSNIAYDLGNNYVIDAERQNMSYYNFEKKNRYKWRTRYEGVDHLVVGSKWLAMTWGEYNKSFKMRLHDVVAMQGGGRDRKVVAKDVALAGIAMEQDLLVWGDYRFDQAGAYLYDTKADKKRRITESQTVTAIDTDGKIVVWKDDDAMHRFNAALGTGEILFFQAKSDSIRKFKIDGDWLVYQDDNDVIYAYHFPTGKELRVTSEIRHKGLVNLADISGRNIIFTVQANQLWVAELPEKVAFELE